MPATVNVGVLMACISDLIPPITGLLFGCGSAALGLRRKKESKTAEL
jgi:hypothetical protein